MLSYLMLFVIYRGGLFVFEALIVPCSRSVQSLSSENIKSNRQV